MKAKILFLSATVSIVLGLVSAITAFSVSASVFIPVACVFLTIAISCLIGLLLRYRAHLNRMVTELRKAHNQANLLESKFAALSEGLTELRSKELASIHARADNLETLLETTSDACSANSDSIAQVDRRTNENDEQLIQLCVQLDQLNEHVDELDKRSSHGANRIAAHGTAIRRLERKHDETSRAFDQALKGKASSARANEVERHAFFNSVVLAKSAGVDWASAFRSRGMLDAIRYYLATRHQWALSVPFAKEYGDITKLNNTELRRLLSVSRALGELSFAVNVIEVLSGRTKLGGDELAYRRYQTELELYRDPFSLVQPPEALEFTKRPNCVLHFVGHALPYKQTGYTMRTKRIVESQRALGLSPVVAVQAGVYGFEETQFETVGTVPHYFLGGASRTASVWDDWLQLNVDQLAQIAAEVRPSVLHAHSDFINAFICIVVGEALDIPVVYEQRGFWEESWLSRTDVGVKAEALSMLNYREMYEFRKARETEMRQRADHVVTLSQVMREHIHSMDHEVGHESSVTIVPNAVDIEQFAVMSDGANVRTDLELRGHVFGYVGSMVHYEGIDILIAAFRLLKTLAEMLCQDDLSDLNPKEIASHLRATAKRTGRALSNDEALEFIKGVQSSSADLSQLRDAKLLLVGGGSIAEKWAQSVDENEGIVFTGQVANDDVAEYYGAIDTFVIPRRPDRVCDLVSPLKPFEAMASGKHVVVSDVRALKEIAEQSGSIETFRAGSVTSLAEQLVNVSIGEKRDDDAGTRAREWCLNNRTWDGNAVRYVRAYNGVLADGTSVDFDVDERYFNSIFEMATQLRRLNGLAATGWFNITPPRATAETIRDEGWRTKKVGTVRLQPGMDWDNVVAQDRTVAFHLHAWEPFDAVMLQYEETRTEEWLDWLESIALDWVQYTRVTSNEDSMAWYDMSLSLRTPRLLRIAKWCLDAGRLNSAVVLLGSLCEHVENLQDPSVFMAQNNHGFYCAASQLDAAQHLGTGAKLLEATASQGRKRMKIMTNRQFASDGGHREHSPAYHLMLLKSFASLVDEGIIDDETIIERIRLANSNLAWMIAPDGKILQFGDTESGVVPEQAFVFEDTFADYVLSKGTRGTAPAADLHVLKKSGYVFVRPSGTPVEKQSYLAYMCAFHSRAHKHADDHTFVWWENGVEILIDPGRFGYLDRLPAKSPDRLKGFFYSRPERQYVERTFAHNCLEIDGEDIERRSRKPFGSGVVSAQRKDSGEFEIIGESPNARYSHRRTLRYMPAEYLEVEDSIVEPHDCETAISWFNVNRDCEISVDHNNVEILLPNDAGKIVVESNGLLVPPVSGQAEPLRGWRSKKDRQLDEAWNFGFKINVGETRVIKTKFKVEGLA